MRLISLKLAGFKSFVDSTTLVFPQNRTAVVGPNGCGKSNVIDAIRWVMGESSARQLRGSAMTDVIFAGTSQRKPVGQASVELRFENTLGKLGGEYNAYTELSVRRQVNREGRSDYFLNGTRCRRRDITDIFLGTGLGPRSYAIIEQGMINRLVDAKPEDMRVFIEEAAGVSRYQARRRETLQHLEHTRQNLSRLQDISDELQSQMRSLKRQSQAAIKFHELEQQQRELTINLWSIYYQHAEHTQQQHTALLTELGEQYRQLRSQRNDAETQWQQGSELLAKLLVDAEPLQQAWQQAEREVSQRQAWLRQYQQDQQQRQQQLEQWQHTLQGLTAQVAQDCQQLEILENSRQTQQLTLAIQQNTLAGLEQVFQQAEMQWQHAEQQAHKTQQQYQQLERQHQQLQQHIEATSRVTLRLEQQIQQTSEQLARLEGQQPQHELDDLMVQQHELGLQKVQLEQVQQKIQQALAQHEIALADSTQQLKTLQTEQQQAQLELNALTKIQGKTQPKANTPKLNTPKPNTSKSNTLKPSSEPSVQRSKLLQQLIIQPAAQPHIQLLEKLMADWLNAELIADFNQSAEQARSYQLNETALSPSTVESHALIHAEVTPLSAWVQPQLSCWQAVGIVATQQLALTLQTHLNASQSLLTLDGFWLGKNWQINLNVDEQAGRQHGMLQQQLRQQELQALLLQINQHIEPIQNQQKLQLAEVEHCKTSLQPIQQQLKQLVQQQRELEVQHARMDSTVQASQQQIAQLSRQSLDLQRGLQDEQEQLGDWQMELAGINLRIKQLMPQLQRDQQQQAELGQQAQAAKAGYQAAQLQVQQLEASLQTLQLQHNNLQQALARAQPQQQHIEQQIAQLTSQQADSAAQWPEQQKQLEINQQQAHAAHQQWSTWQQQLESRQLEQQRLSLLRQQGQDSEDQLRDQMEQTRLHWQDCKNKMQQALEQLASINAEPVAADISTLSSVQAQLEKVQQQIQKLGHLNLAAPEALQEISERHAELEYQMADLQQTVDQLEQAMQSIDLETRSLFMSTFEQVNTELKVLFPKVFGGGEASLSLEDDWQSGIRLMARPPGKRNSTLALLSGGEKALTALALVFAIFRLNPAPFCVLDEVDAPLDDANVQRFCHLVKELSQHVQFIYITHNKLAMTMATDLLGVTMPEAGASRLVAVNIEQAAKFSATSE